MLGEPLSMEYLWGLLQLYFGGWDWGSKIDISIDSVGNIAAFVVDSSKALKPLSKEAESLIR
jgi:hypothetical protein